MSFSSLSFIFIFLPIFLVLYYMSSTVERRQFLLVGSLVFYGMGNPVYVLLLMVSVIVNYGFSLILCTRDKKRPQKKKKITLVMVIALNLAVLCMYKYWNSLAHALGDILGVGWIPEIGIGLPPGISFYTFQILSYQIDCYTKKKKRAASFMDFALFVCMFPQLISGPIIRFGQVEKELKTCRKNLTGLERGAKGFVIGLGMKVLLADQLATLYNSIGIIGVDSMSVPLAWLGAVTFSLQLYFDFQGYSMMAVGLGEMLGIEIPENFRQPYWSKSISEFWRRWHVTLGEWFKDYVYIPLGGNRKGIFRTFFNLFVVWMLTGLWHGASWNFIVWGLVFFLLISLEKTGMGKWLEKTKVLGHVYVLCLLPVTWVIFSMTDMRSMIQYIGCMFGVGSVNGATQMNQFLRFVKQYWGLLLAGVLFATPFPMWLYGRHKRTWYTVLILLAVFWFSAYQLYIGKNNPFMYFMF